MTADTPILKAHGLIVRRGGVGVLDLPHLAVHPGETLALIGPNGAGKSTLLLTLAGLLKPAAGTVSFHGQVISGRAALFAYRRAVAMVFQEPLLFDSTVADNIAAGLKLRHLGRDQIRQRVEAYAGRFGIAHLLGRSARKLSGGEAQRTSLARAFAVEPAIIYLDEPFSSLDPPSRESLIEDLGRILKETHTAAVMATHDQGEGVRLARRIAVMHAGHIVQAGPVHEVMNHPADAFVAAFVGMETAVEGTVLAVDRGLMNVTTAGGEIQAVGQASPGDRVLLGIRPEHVTLIREEPRDSQATSARNILNMRIVRIVPKGPLFKVELNGGIPLTAYITHPSLEELALYPGQAIQASFKASAVHIIKMGKP